MYSSVSGTLLEKIIKFTLSQYRAIHIFILYFQVRSVDHLDNEVTTKIFNLKFSLNCKEKVLNKESDTSSHDKLWQFIN